MTSLQDRKLRVLVISSADPYKGPGVLASDLRDSLIAHGHDCDILTKNQIESHPEILYVYKHRNNILYKLLSKIVLLIKYVMFSGVINNRPPYYFFYKSERNPPVNVSKILSRISKPYNIVYIYFWQGLLSFKTVEAIYGKLHCQIHFAGVDYSHMSGGCHFTIDCERYKSGCGKCPAWKSGKEDDFTHENVRYRDAVYKKVHPVVWGNTYEQSFYRQSYLLRNYDRIELAQATIDENMFRPMDATFLRAKYSIDSEKKFIIMFGSQSVDDPRKGFNYLCDALRILGTRLIDKQRKEILLMTIGKADAIISDLPFATRSLGYIPYNQLPEIYSLANLFVCPSVYDAGPMMVNQAIMCGTPVVGFEIGVLIDLVKGRGTGLCAEYKDTQSLCECIEQIYNLFETDYDAYYNMRSQCRMVGFEELSKESQIKRIILAYDKYR